MSQPLVPELDGKTHINIYSKARTELGRTLSNFAHTPFTHSALGSWASIEGFWYWYLIPENDQITYKDKEPLSKLSGFEAKRLGRELARKAFGKVQDWPSSSAQYMHTGFVKLALETKAEQYPHLAKGIAQTNLPLTHYYFMSNRVIPCPQDWTHRWWMQYLPEKAREAGYKFACCKGVSYVKEE